jgi:hypothetical protein
MVNSWILDERLKKGQQKQLDDRKTTKSLRLIGLIFFIIKKIQASAHSEGLHHDGDTLNAMRELGKRTI